MRRRAGCASVFVLAGCLAATSFEYVQKKPAKSLEIEAVLAASLSDEHGFDPDYPLVENLSGLGAGGVEALCLRLDETRPGIFRPSWDFSLEIIEVLATALMDIGDRSAIPALLRAGGTTYYLLENGG